MNTAKIKDWLYLFGIAGAILFGLFTIYGLPPRVEKMEQKVASHEDRLTRSDVKMDIMLEDVKTIKNILMRQQRGDY